VLVDDRAGQALPPERPPQPNAGAAPAAADATRGLDDPRALSILTTEHWSLLSARALVYNEAFARGGMFLTFLSATLVALGLVSTATGFSREFLFIAAAVLAVDLFMGVATLGRVAAATADDLRYIAGMNRLRHAYHEMVPGLDRYFISGRHDDIRGVFEVYGATDEVMSRPGILHGLTTTPGMLAAICSAIAAALSGVIVLFFSEAPMVAGIVALAVLVLANVYATVFMGRQIGRFARSLRAEFPSPER
jgi:hypothetical protein